MLKRYWSINRSGSCRAPSCPDTPGTLEHLLVECPALSQTRERLYQMWLERTVMFPTLHSTIRSLLESDNHQIVQFVLEPLAFTPIFENFKSHGINFTHQLAYLTRTFAFYMHREYQKLLQNLNPPNNPAQLCHPTHTNLSISVTECLQTNHTVCKRTETVTSSYLQTVTSSYLQTMTSSCLQTMTSTNMTTAPITNLPVSLPYSAIHLSCADRACSRPVVTVTDSIVCSSSTIPAGASLTILATWQHSGLAAPWSGSCSTVNNYPNYRL